MINVRERNGKWQYDITFRWPDGTDFRERKNSPVTSKSGTQRYAQDRERYLLTAGKQVASAAPALKDFWPRVMRDHYVALRRKTGTKEGAEQIYRDYLGDLYERPLDQISNSDISSIKASMGESSPKTVNNVLSTLSVALKCAIEWDVIKAMPCTIKLLPLVEKEMEFYEVPQYRALVKAAAGLGPLYESIILLAGSAGLRASEIRALKWGDIDMPRRTLTVARSFSRGIEGTTKGGRSRKVNMTEELCTALTAYGPGHVADRVFLNDESEDYSVQNLATKIGLVETVAGFERTERVHIFRHSFCSHLAMAGVAPKAIQELAGHADLKTTMRYMHLSPQNKSDAIKTLNAFYTLQMAV